MTEPSPVPLETRREAQQISRALWDVVTRGDRSTASAMAAAVGLFRVLWKLAADEDMNVGHTPAEAFAALSAVFDAGHMKVDDDPAEGRYVHPEHPTAQ